MTISNRAKFAIVFVVVNLHVLRDLSLVLYLAMYVPVVATVVIQYVLTRKDRLAATASGMFHLWIAVGLCGFAVSLLFISTAGAAQGLIRFLFAAPLYLALVLYTKTVDDLRRHVVTVVAFFALASLSIPLQLVTGPIAWFADASERNGFERYASLLGSLTSVGIVVGCYIVLAQASTPAWRSIWIAMMIIPSIISLNKSAIANIAVALLVLAFLNRRALSKMVVAYIFAGGLVLGIYAFVPIVQERVAASLISFGIHTTASAGILQADFSIEQSVFDRIVTLPKANFDALADLHSGLVYFTGGGFGMANTALVPLGDVLAPMAHNQFAESLTVFGLIGGTIQLGVLFRIGLLLKRRAKAGVPMAIVILSAYAVLLVNSLFANGTVYQPSSASVFYLAFFAATSSLLAVDPTTDSSTLRYRRPFKISRNLGESRER